MQSSQGKAVKKKPSCVSAVSDKLSEFDSFSEKFEVKLSSEKGEISSKCGLICTILTWFLILIYTYIKIKTFRENGNDTVTTNVEANVYGKGRNFTGTEFNLNFAAGLTSYAMTEEPEEDERYA